MNKTQLPFFTLLVMMSFASVNAMLFTPALPNIAKFFQISEDAAQQTITWFLVGYALGQLIYGPFANRFGRKPALQGGIFLQILSSFICVFAATIHAFWLLVIGRFLLALGSGVGLKMTFTLVNECYGTEIASQKISYLSMGFAIIPGLAIALGGVLNTYYGWASCFYAGACYGIILLLLTARLSETLKTSLDIHAFKLKHLIVGYSSQLKNKKLMAGAFLMAGCTGFVYVFAAEAPFTAINLLGMSSTEYGIINILPTAGMMMGGLFSPQFIKKYSPRTAILLGIVIAGLAALAMLLILLLGGPPLISIFLPMTFLYFGSATVYANAAAIAMAHADDKAYGSAVMNFISLAIVTILVLSLVLFPSNKLVLPVVYIIMISLMMIILRLDFRSSP